MCQRRQPCRSCQTSTLNHPRWWGGCLSALSCIQYRAATSKNFEYMSTPKLDILSPLNPKYGQIEPPMAYRGSASKAAEWRRLGLPVCAARIFIPPVCTLEPLTRRLPKLSTKQARRTSPNVTLIGMLAAGNCIGPSRHARKRIRPMGESIRLKTSGGMLPLP